MSIDTTKLRELAQAARPGPWERDICQIDKMWLKGRLQECVTNQDAIVMAVTAEDDATAEYIAAANPATVLALLDEIKNSRAVLKSYSKVLVEISESLDIAPFHFTTPVAVERCKRLIAIEKAARNLAKVKGRHHSEQAMNQLLETLK
jgi:hypothetical protein